MTPGRTSPGGQAILRAVPSRERCSVVSKSPTEAGVGGERGADALFCCGKPRGAGRSWGLAVPPLGVGAMARKEGAVTQSREGLEDSPDQVVGPRPAVEPVHLGSPWESSRLADRGVVARMGGTTQPSWSQGPVG